ncbi:MAG: YibE/F family protein [Elusimicrobiota bacterium]|nr:YibE/F family protein [Elusimicrobiota bacterium]
MTRNFSFLFFALFLSVSASLASSEFVTGRLVVSSLSRANTSIEETEFLILNGRFKGAKVHARNYLWDDPAYNTVLRSGDKATLRIDYGISGEIERVTIKGYSRGRTLIFFLAGFVLLLFAVIGRRAAAVLAAMTFNIFLFISAFVPVLKSGFNPVAAVFLFSVISAGVTLILITGLSKKSAAAAAGTAGSIILASLLAFVFLKAAHISGFYSDGARMIMAMTRAGGIAEMDFFLLVVGAIMLAALGMAVDVSVGVASFVQELHDERSDMSAIQLCRRGISVGGDMLATMINSLIFVFAGASLALVLNARICGVPFLRFINYEAVSGIILQSLLASFVLILTIPATSLTAAYLFAGREERRSP